MHIVKRFFLWTSRVVFQLELLIWLSVAPTVLLLGSPLVIEQVLDKSKIYDQLPGIVLEQSAVALGENTAAGQDPVVQQVLRDAFTKAQAKSYSENFIDGMYHWLNGNVAKPDFKIELGATKEAIAEGVSARAATRLASLPACTQMPSGSLDPFTIECLPPGVDIANVKSLLKNDLLANKNFLPNATITADELPKNAEGKPFTEYAKNLPGYFQFYKRLPWIVGGAGVLTALAIIWLDNNKRRGIRLVGRLILANGSFVFVTTLLFLLVLPSLSDSLRPRYISGEIAPLMNDLIIAIIKAINKVMLISSGALVGLGGLILLAERFIFAEQKNETDVETASNTLVVEDTKTSLDKTK